MPAIHARDYSRKRFRPPAQQFNSNVNLIIVSTAGEGQFAAHDDLGRLLVVSSRQPLLDACRALLGKGVELQRLGHHAAPGQRRSTPCGPRLGSPPG